MSDWLDAALGNLEGTHEEKVRAFVASLENELHHGAGTTNLSGVLRELVERSGEVSAALLVGVKPSEVKAAVAAQAPAAEDA